MRVEKLDGRLAVEIPLSVIEAMELDEGDDIPVHFGDLDFLEKRLAARRTKSVSAIRAMRVPLAADYRFKRSEAYETGRE